MSSFKSGVQLMIATENVIPGRNSRLYGLDQTKVEEYASSYEQHGQLQACLVRPLPGQDGKAELIVGFHRHAAMVLHNERNPAKPLKLKCVQVNCNAEEALTKNIIENKMRCDPSHIDEAHAQRLLREEHGWDNARIAELYHYDTRRVAQLAKFLGLSAAIQFQIHAKELTYQAAVELSNMEQPEAVLAEVLDEMQAEHAVANDEPAPAPVLDAAAEANGQPEANGKYAPQGQPETPEQLKVREDAAREAGQNRRKLSTSQRVVAKARDAKIAKGGKVARSLADVKRDLGEWCTELDGPAKEFCIAFARYISGGMKGETMQKKIAEAFPAPAEVPAS